MATSDTNNYLELETETGDTIKVWRRAHPRARRLRLTVTSGGARVSYPEGTHPAQVFAFLRKHANWLERKLDELQLDQAGPPSLRRLANLGRFRLAPDLQRLDGSSSAARTYRHSAITATRS